ncbi:MAG: SCP2 sterol-binding domain-containing protein [Defluviitaleaceae bacterium]|nr:SCP2 sterol-binding domain-containing protein [Defluviitaleaceae bacterium]
MKIAYISGNPPHFDKGLAKLLTYTRSVFTELGVQTSELNLGEAQPPYYNGTGDTNLDGMINPIKDADGIILACSASFFAPSAIMQTFIEYLALPVYADLFKDKHCALIVVSEGGGERGALQYLSRVVQHLGGYDTTHIGLQAAHLDDMEEGNFTRDFIDKEMEDFYRALRQNRKRIVPQDYAQGAVDVKSLVVAPSQKRKPDDPIVKATPTGKVTKRLDAFTEQQEREIEELSRLFAKKYTDTEEDGGEIIDEVNEDEIDDEIEELLAEEEPVIVLPARPARKKTARQLTQNLPHYFQPQLSAGTQAVIQINVTGAEAFEGYLSIRSKECTYTEGTTETPDVTVIADSATWLDVLNSKFTAQKAFMIGGLKVRGALALFTKFDTLFKLG